jgi:RUN domain-containing protein 1
MRHHINRKKSLHNSTTTTVPETSEDETDDFKDDDRNDDDTDSENDGAERVYSKTQRLEHKEIRGQLASELLTTVRKNLAITLQKLIQHGLRRPNESSSLVPFIGCFFIPSQQVNQEYHARSQHYRKSAENGDEEEWGNEISAWELILEYYHIKNGEIYNETPARKLSLSYNLDIVGNTQVSNKQSLFSAIGSIIQIHSPYKRSYNTHFKAFVSAGLK